MPPETEVDVSELDPTKLEAELDRETDKDVDEGADTDDEEQAEEEEGEGAADEGADADDEDLDDEEEAEPAADARAEDLEEDATGKGPPPRDDGAQWNAEAQRWQKDGKFVEGAAPTPEQLAKPAADTAPATTPTWEPLAIRADRRDHTIPEAQLSRHGDHVYVGVHKDKWNDFTNRLSVGVVAQRMSRELDRGLREVAEEKAALQAAREAPKPPSDAEIEAKVWLEELKRPVREDGGSRITEVFDPNDLEVVELKVRLAQKEAHEQFQKEEQEREQEWASNAVTSSEDDTVQARGLAGVIVEVADSDPAFAHLSEDQLREVYQTLMPYRRAVVFREGAEWRQEPELVLEALKRKVAEPDGKSAPRTDAGPPGQAGAPNAVARAERFNAGVESAAKPLTTSVKARRGVDQRTAENRPGREGRRKRRSTRDQRAENSWRQTTRAFMSSPGLDFPDAE